MVGKMKIGFFGLLQIAFIVLKLTDYIDWSWPVVLVPSIIWCFLVVLYIALAAWLDKNDPLWRMRK